MIRNMRLLVATITAATGIFSCITFAHTGPSGPIILRTTVLLDGRGNVLHNTAIVVEKGKILRLDPHARGTTYDLRGLTVLPGWIDAHVHVSWHFGPDGKLA